MLGLDVFPDMKPLHISLNTAHSGSKPSSIISSFTHSLQVFLLPVHLTPAPTRLPPNHLHSYMFHMPKPPQSSTPRHFSHALNTQKTVEDLASLLIFQRHTTHPSHHMLCSIRLCRFLAFTAYMSQSTYVNTLWDTGTKHLSVHEIGCDTGCKDGR